MIKEILFQKIVNKWHAFVEIDGEFYSAVLPEGLDPRKSKLDLNQIVEMATTRKSGPKFGEQQANE
jgi:hypothetical protein